MNLFVELTAIDVHKEDQWYLDMERTRNQALANSGSRDVDYDEFDEDDLENAINPEGAPAEDTDEGAEPGTVAETPTINPPAGTFYSTMVFENDIREIYGRRHRQNRPGSRIVYRSGQPRLVKETYEEIKAKFAAARRSDSSED